MKKTHQFGLWAERAAMIFLLLKDYRILHWRFKSQFGEIDIIAKKSAVIAIIEVKARRSKIPLPEVLRISQIRRIKKSAEYFIATNPHLQSCGLRLDFIEVNKFFLPKHFIGLIE